MNTWIPRKEHFRNLSEYIKTPENFKAAVQEDEDSDLYMSKWLARLSLLYGVPFNYLVPDERMLPVESIRFFHLDRNWIRALLDGACSIGRNTAADVSHDLALIDSVCTQAVAENYKIRAGLQGKIHLRDPVAKTSVPSGFLLRSAIVKGWPGLEIKAYRNAEPPDGQESLNILRMERLSENILLCIFEDTFQRLELAEPPEGLHYGADLMPDGTCKKVLRNLKQGSTPIGAYIDKATVSVPMRDGANRVVDIKALVNGMEEQLKIHGAFDQYFTSAEFAVEMIENAQMGVFENTLEVRR